MEKEQEKKCFIVTPIGSDTDPIRRHIDGIIEASLRPALGDKYKLIVAHKIYEPGSITKQVITEIYNAELVIANLTNRNPNVMYELAFRHSLGKPIIMIAEAGTNLPLDIIMERVIFYQNDAQGVLDLRKALEKAESEIDFSKTESPIHDVLRSINRDKNILQISRNDTQTGQEVLPYILDKLNRLEDVILTNKFLINTASSHINNWDFQFPLSNVPEKDQEEPFYVALRDTIFSISSINVHNMRLDYSNKKFTVQFYAPMELTQHSLIILFENAFCNSGLKNIGKPTILKI